MKYFLRQTLAVALLPIASFAQSNFKPGYITQTDGSNVKCLINYRQWDENPKKVGVKLTNNAPLEQHDAKSISGFGIEQTVKYQSFVINATVASVQASRLTLLDTTARTDTAFLKVITDGQLLTLYNYTDDVKTRYYVKENNETVPKELIYRKYFDASNNSVVKNQFRSQLTRLAFNLNKTDAKFINEINYADYIEKDLISIINKLNGVTEKQQANSKSAGSVRYFAGVGVNLQKLNYSGMIDLADNAQSSSSAFPVVYLGLDLLPNKDIQRYFIRFEASLTDANMKVVKSNTHIANQRSVSISPQFIYNFYNKTALRIFAGTGVKANFSSYQKNQFISDQNKVTEGYPKLQSVWLSVPFHAGFTLNNRYELNVAYFYTSSITDYVTFSAAPQIYQAGFKYLFN